MRRDLAEGLSLYTVETPSLGDRSYVAIHDGFAVAVDVQRDLDRVETLLEEHGVRLKAVLETHLHNDYLTGGLALARRHQATYVVPAGPALGYSATRAQEGATFRFGALTLRTVDSPGHTDAHAAYSLHIENGSALAAFTGGSLLLGATGRTDLLGRELAEPLARRQYWSVRRLARVLGADAIVLPTHGFGSFCVAGGSTPSGDSVAEQLAANPAYLMSEEEFVADLLGRLGPYPDYYAFMGPRNTGGVFDADLPTVPRLPLGDLASCDNIARCVVDIRPREQWADGRIPGSICIDGRGSVATWLGWLFPIDTPVSLIAEDDAQANAVLRDLHRVGFDDVRAVHISESAHEWSGFPKAKTATFKDLGERIGLGEPVVVVDAREKAEWHAGHIRGAMHVPVHGTETSFAEPHPGQTLWIHCAAGMRATIAGSLLLRHGVDVVIVDDDIHLARGSGIPWCEASSCSDHLCTAGVSADLTGLSTMT